MNLKKKWKDELFKLSVTLISTKEIVYAIRMRLSNWFPTWFGILIILSSLYMIYYLITGNLDIKKEKLTHQKINFSANNISNFREKVKSRGGKYGTKKNV